MQGVRGLISWIGFSCTTSPTAMVVGLPAHEEQQLRRDMSLVKKSELLTFTERKMSQQDLGSC